MIDHEIDRIAAAMHQLRPDWPAVSIRTLIHKHLADRPRRDVAVALAWVACEPGTSTPARVLEAGPWWKAAGVEGTASKREPWDAGSFCAVCQEPADRCARLWSADHEFVSAAHWAQRTDQERTERRTTTSAEQARNARERA